MSSIDHINYSQCIATKSMAPRTAVTYYQTIDNDFYNTYKQCSSMKF